MAEAQLPLNVSDGDAIDELRVLVAAGLVAALRLRTEAGPGGTSVPMVRVLAITPDGRRLLMKSSESGTGKPTLASSG